MYLKILEMQGFKSFPERTRLEFGEGVTAVVGPNGSGKSNIADAIRWVLGEQSVKNLRGGRMDDVIFSGTSERRSLGFAQVSVTIDNAEKKLPVEFTEITVARRIFRSGENEYLLNGAAVRLKDINEIFTDTGLGREGYSIIGQGRIDEILNARSEDRRHLFEEAAGIAKFKNRKLEAERKLERQRQDVVRADDIIREVQSQLEPLGVQAETAKKYLGLTERLKIVQIGIFLNETDGAAKKADDLNRNIENIKNQCEREHSDREALAQKKANLTDEIEATDAERDEIKINIDNINADINDQKNAADLLTQKIEFLAGDIARLLGSLADGGALLVGHEKAKNDAEIILNEIEKRLAANENALSKAEYALKLLNDAGGDGGFNALNGEILVKTAEISAKETEIKQLEKLYGDLETQKENAGDIYAGLEAHIKAKQDELSDAEKKLNALDKKMSEAIDTAAYYEKETAALTAEERVKNDEYIVLVKKANELRERHRILNELNENREGYYKGVRAVLDKKAESPVEFAGIRGVAAELMSVKPGYETAVETALGASAQHIVVDTEADAGLAIEYLKHTQRGRASFLPLTAVKPVKHTEANDRMLDEPGIEGMAREFITAETVYGAVFDYLLSGTFVADNYKNAVIFYKKYRYARRVVTKDGELLSPGGVITGGRDRQSFGIIARKRELDELVKALPEYETNERELSVRLRAVRGKIIKYADELQKTRAGLERGRAEILGANNDLSKIKEQAAALSAKMAETEASDAALMDRLVETNVLIRKHVDELDALNRRLGSVKLELENFVNNSEADKEKRDVINTAVTGLKIENAELVQQKKHQEDVYKRAVANISADGRDTARIETEIQKTRTELGLAESQKNAAAERVIALNKSLGQENARLIKLSEYRIKLTGDAAGMDAEAAARADALTGMNNELIRLETRKEQADSDLRRLYDAMWEDYEITAERAREYPRVKKSANQLAAEERSLKNGIKDLGNVNVNAIEEYKNKKDRYDFLTSQRDDVVSGAEKLTELIKALESQMESQFKDSIAKISQNFDMVFKEMFGGGQAQVLLSGDENALDAGVDIKAQPPGKNLQTLTLLSGGEKALTAMALIFGILRMKPSPFCVLDEIEAALDESNVLRFINYIKKIAEESQVILITHKKGTMAAADALYGVAMQERGVSKLISVKFEEGAETEEAV